MLLVYQRRGSLQTFLAIYYQMGWTDKACCGPRIHADMHELDDFFAMIRVNRLRNLDCGLRGRRGDSRQEESAFRRRTSIRYMTITCSSRSVKW